MKLALKQILQAAGIKFVRILWCDNANIIRAKAAHIDYLEEYIDNGVGTLPPRFSQAAGGST